MAATRLILFAHGSRDPRWRAPFEDLLLSLKRELGEARVRLAYMEFVPPTLDDVAGEAVRDGVTHLRLLPLFFSAGAHVSQDIPSQAAEVRSRHPDLALEILPPVGEDPDFRALLLRLGRQALEGRR